MDRTAVLSILNLAQTYEVGLQVAGPGLSSSVLHGSVPISATSSRALRSQIELTARLLNDLAIHRQPGWRGDRPAVAESLISLGRLIYTQAIPPAIQQALNYLSPTSPLVVVSNDPSLPWELAHDGHEFLAIKHAMGRQIMTREMPRQSQTPKVRRWAPLLIGNPTNDLPHAGNEIEQLARLLDAVPGSARPRVLMTKRATKDAVFEALSSGSYDLIHYAGHVAIDAAKPHASGLVLANGELLTAAEIETHLTGQPVVFLNACRSAAGRGDDEPEGLAYLGEAANGLVSAFVQGGALAVTGSLWPIHDAGSSDLALDYYRQALHGVSLGEALLAARRTARDLAPHDPLWASVVLYGDPSLRLVVTQRSHSWPATVLAVHLRGLDVLFKKEPEKAVEVVQHWIATLSSEMVKHGGEAAGFAHDMFIATFGVSANRGNDTEQGVRAALAVQDAIQSQSPFSMMPVGQGIGLSTGVVFISQNSDTTPTRNQVMGEAVGEACMLARQADDGQILLTEPSEQLTRQVAITVPVALSYSSSANDRSNYRLIGLKPEPELPGSRLRLIGRSQELEALLEAWRCCQVGTGQLVSVVGEPGIGKSRLLYEFRMALQGQDVVWLDASCSSAFQPATYALLTALFQSILGIQQTDSIPEKHARLRVALQSLSGIGLSERMVLDGVAILGDMLAAPFPEIPVAHLDLARRQQRLLQVLEHFLSQFSAERPVMVVFEDLHWADEASLDLLNRLVTGISTRPIMVLALYRSEDGWRPPWSDRSNHRRLHLGRLSIDASRLLLAELLEAEEVPEEIAQAVLPRAGGNPFFLRQLVTSLQESMLMIRPANKWYLAQSVDVTEIPATVQRVILNRIQRLSLAAQKVLSIIAVAGDQIPRSVLEAVTSGTTDEVALDNGLNQLIEREFLLKPLGEDLYRFGHALVRATVYANMYADECRRYHRRLGRAFLQVYAGHEDDVVEPLGEHFYRSVVQAGDRISIVEDADPGILDEATTYLIRAGANAMARFAPREAVTRYEQALLVVGRLDGDRDHLQAVCHEGLGDAYSLLGEFERALSYYQGALSATPEDILHTADLNWKIAVVLERQARYEDAATWLDCGLKALSHHPDDEVLSKIAVYYGMIRYRQGQQDDAMAWAEKSMVHETAQAHNIMAIVLRARGELRPAEEHCLRSIELAEKASDLVVLAKANTNLGVVLFELGDWQEALLANERALKLQTDIGDAYMHALTICNLSDIHRHLGNLEIAIDFARRGLHELEVRNSEFGQALAHLNWGLALLAQDKPQLARVEHLEIARSLMEDHAIQDMRGQVLWGIAECLMQEGHLEDASIVAEQALTAVLEQKSLSDEGVVRCVLGQIQAARGQSDQARQYLIQSLEILQAHGSAYQMARTQMALSRLYGSDSSRTEEAETLFKRAYAVFLKLNARTDLSTADDWALSLPRQA